jgi:hypothetical protein
MKPPTPAMIRALRQLIANPGLHYVDNETHNALLRRGLITCRCCCELTPEGRRVLAEHTTGDE